VIPNAALFSYLVVFGEIAVGLALILGLFTGIASFFGGFMNASFIFAGTAGANPLCSSCRPGSCWPGGSQGIGALTVGFCLP
jgi:uncharacterized membrane protein YphA (DoxX/SURF4 family)